MHTKLTTTSGNKIGLPGYRSRSRNPGRQGGRSWWRCGRRRCYISGESDNPSTRVRVLPSSLACLWLLLLGESRTEEVVGNGGNQLRARESNATKVCREKTAGSVSLRWGEQGKRRKSASVPFCLSVTSLILNYYRH
jgi:hypothetical protein